MISKGTGSTVRLCPDHLHYPENQENHPDQTGLDYRSFPMPRSLPDCHRNQAYRLALDCRVFPLVLAVLVDRDMKLRARHLHLVVPFDLLVQEIPVVRHHQEGQRRRRDPNKKPVPAIQFDLAIRVYPVVLKRVFKQQICLNTNQVAQACQEVHQDKRCMTDPVLDMDKMAMQVCRRDLVDRDDRLLK
jgi:hypothetical protein